MSSGFVSGGTADAPIERSDEWLVAQKEIDANAVRKAEAARQTEERSLFETLEANKAAKQDAFEEANRLKNQFRALDEDEVEFLDSVLESTRADEDRVKRETAEGLALFRQQQEEADKARRGSEGVAVAEAGSPIAEEETWISGARKRKRAKEKDVLKGVKIRRSSTANEIGKLSEEAASATGDSPATKKQSTAASADATVNPNKATSSSSTKTAVVVKKPPAKPSLGLVDYCSDEDDD
ncbi:hypothetical protein LHYA1_G004589 [Lachnellula hyalina]|uniref:FAM192A/Fyv6 N-terminal domain-containing protein n=1 Tax=Lachnellula hyalina TaxID=1316788 RepID=A0A8H8R166_9HELO|nr:uncharacterized protein LHYA1_G004589 [Lachnellula hyalina]TVY25776.1 hypothetical protein LHYA1_G004589 [Lachnellula hyalina]